ncbi:hypothetical protein KFE94_16745 [bacterium SCSIO 12643]|nr:hypothetical protein KFE94_16745 [bacterium SCSIO 12643]
MIKKLTLRWNWVYKSIIIVLLFGYCTGNAQDCGIKVEDYNKNYEFYFDIDSIPINYHFEMVLIGTNGNEINDFHLFCDGNNYFVKEKSEVIKIRSKQKDELDALLEGIEVPNEIVTIYTNEYSRHYFEMMVMKLGNSKMFFVPMVSTMEVNYDCIYQKFPQYKEIIKIFREIYFETKKVTR